MLRQDLKDLYFLANRMLVYPNTLLAQLRYRSRSDLMLHLGCGDDYIEGLINIDGNFRRRAELWLDLRNRLPFADRSAKFIYSSHMLEHLYPEQALTLLREARRVLAPGGLFRLAVPSFEHCLAIANGVGKSEWPRAFTTPAAQAINYIFCDGQHKYAYCREVLEVMCEQAGFRAISFVEWSPDAREIGGVSIHSEPPGSLIVEMGA